jgi:predicted GIY-YIG superfamily endonuclease
MQMLDQPLVSQYLETISGTALERYQRIIRAYVKRRHGIYALYRRDRLYYVGLAKNLRNRLNQHLKDKHKGRWDRFSVYLTIGDSHLKELETLVLRIVQPEGNSQSGKFKRAQNLKRKLARDITAHYKSELDNVLNRQRSVKLVTKSIVAQANGRSLAGLLEKRIKLKGLHRQKWYSARLLLNGNISFAGKRYATPSLAAKAVTGKPSNGWWFWRYERAPGDWVRLRELKRH